MGQVIVLTPQPIFAAANATIVQDINQAIDVSMFDQIDLQFGLLSYTSGSVGVDIITSMTNSYDDQGKTLSSWAVKAGGTVPLGAAGYSTASYPNGSNVLLRFIRWQISGTYGAAVLTIQGIARRKH